VVTIFMERDGLDSPISAGDGPLSLEAAAPHQQVRLAPLHRSIGERGLGPAAATVRRRIAIAVTKLDRGGSIDVANQVANGLRERGHQVETWFLYAARPDLIANYPTGTRLFFPGAPRGPADYLRIVAGLRMALRDFKPQTVHGVMPLANVLALAAAALTGVPTRVASHHVPSSTIGATMRLLDRLAGSVGIYTANIAVSAAVRESFARHSRRYRRIVEVVPNGVEDRSSGLSAGEARARLGLPPGVPLVGTIGRLAAQKNQAFLLDLMTMLPDVHLAIAGSGELEADLRRKTADLQLTERVHFLGFLAGSQVEELLRALDLFLFPSLFEGMPLALVEAMSAGAAIVASDIPPNREVAVDDGGELSIGLLGIESREQWADMVKRLLDDDVARARIAASARRRAQTFSMPAMISRYEELLAGPGSRSAP
jgi:glycosyltransferase involved in cell wall biosynthesis